MSEPREWYIHTCGYGDGTVDWHDVSANHKPIITNEITEGPITVVEKDIYDALKTQLDQLKAERDDAIAVRDEACAARDQWRKADLAAKAWRAEAERLAGALELVVNHGKEAREGYGPEFDPVELAAVKALAEYEAFKAAEKKVNDP